MKKILLTITMLLTLALSAQGVAAQVEAPEIESVDYSEIDGLQSVYSRAYTVDFMAMMSSPDANLEEMDMAAMMRNISIQGYTFESEDQAKAFLDTTKEEAEGGLTEAEDLGEVEMKDLEAVDKEGVTMTMVMDLEGESIAMTVHMFVDGNHLFMVISTDSDLDASNSKADAVAQYVVDAEVQNEEVTFSEDGTSTGGVFDRMPTSDDEIVGDLTSTMDTELHVAGE